MEKIFNNLLCLHHQIETNIMMMLEKELNKIYEDINVDCCYRRIYIKEHEFKFRIVDDYIYIEYIDTKCLLHYTPYRQTQSIKTIIEFIEDVIKQSEKYSK